MRNLYRPDLVITLKQQAQASGKSINQQVLDDLKEHTGHHNKSISPRNSTIWILFSFSGWIATFITSWATCSRKAIKISKNYNNVDKWEK